MNKPALLLIVPILFVACQSRSSKSVSIVKTTKNDTIKPLVKPPVPDGITGIYYAESLDGQSESCNMSVGIKKSAAGYSYELSLNGEQIKGKAYLKKGDDKETYINFEGIKWAEYEGDVSDETKQRDTSSLEQPVGVDGVLSGKKIIIQNTGNSMNYYVKFAGCDEKYIRLVKRQL